MLLGDDDENAFGGRKGITTTSFKTTGNNAFTDPPKCMMQRQGNFITGFWPEDVQADLPGKVDVMPFPAYEGGYDGTPCSVVATSPLRSTVTTRTSRRS